MLAQPEAGVSPRQMKTAIRVNNVLLIRLSMHQENFDRLNEVFGASDRSAAIVGAAYLEDKLTDCIGSRLVDDKATCEKLFKPNKSIGNLGVKADLGFLLGLYGEETRDDILRIATMRNWFAHWSDHTTFATREVRVECEKLALMDRFFESIDPKMKPDTRPDNCSAEEWARFLFMRFVDTMAMFLEGMSKEPLRPSKPPYPVAD